MFHACQPKSCDFDREKTPHVSKTSMISKRFSLVFSSLETVSSKPNWTSSSLVNWPKMVTQELKYVLLLHVRKSLSWPLGPSRSWEKRAGGSASWLPSCRRGSTSATNPWSSTLRRLPRGACALSLKPSRWDTSWSVVSLSVGLAMVCSGTSWSLELRVSVHLIAFVLLDCQLLLSSTYHLFFSRRFNCFCLDVSII